MVYGHFTARSAYAELVCEDTENGGLLVFVKQTRGSVDGEGRITLAPDQVAKLRTWLGEDRDADQCACPELHPGTDHATWAEALAANEPGDIPFHLETRAEYEARTSTAARSLISGVQQCGHDDYHGSHTWADHPHMECPGYGS